uniref:UDENN domain-containing protein n=1 Tax=Heligmosomoides polygyrus TaxID=6339 RepID=A0A183G7E0_HELPZ
LETARTMATFDEIYERLCTIIYVLFDLKHQVLLPYLTRTNATVAGVLVLDGVLHFDAFPTSQGVPDGFEETFPTAARELYEHQHMGDFIEVIGRERKDDDVAQHFYTAFARSTATLANDWSFQPWLLLLRLPVESLTSVEDMQRMHPYLFTDHSSFLFHSHQDINLPTIYVSDTLKLRGVRQYCSYCDSLFMLTEQNMRFLTVIVETVIRTVVFLSESEDEGEEEEEEEEEEEVEEKMRMDDENDD